MSIELLSYKKYLCVYALCIFFLGINFSDASVSSGTINSTAYTAKVCHTAPCVTPAPGTINFRPTGTTPVTIIDATGIHGVAWGNELGWIQMNPTGPEGLTISPTTGIISGKAWSQVAGWINFSVTGQSVAINASGEFTGWAWAGGPYGGWIRFDCASPSSCVKTDWRPQSARAGIDSDGDGNNDTVEDAGFNGGDGNGDGIADSTQNTVAGVSNPVTGGRATLHVSGGCNIISAFSVQQEAISTVQDSAYDFPVGLNKFTLSCGAPGQTGTVSVFYDRVYDTSTWTWRKYNSVLQTYTNINAYTTVTLASQAVGGTPVTKATFTLTDGGATDEDGVVNSSISDPSGPGIPPALVAGVATGNGPVTGTNDPAVSPSDVCANITGLQTELPVGYIFDGYTCVLPPVDVCLNLPGGQSQIPQGYTQDMGGLCFIEIDYCPNISDIQYAIPGGYTVNSAGSCIELSATDVCPRTPGFQTVYSQCVVMTPKNPQTKPAGTVQDVVEEILVTDICPNIVSDQDVLPQGYTRDAEGTCVPVLLDHCPNIIGAQTEIPLGYEIADSGNCVHERNINIEENKNKTDVVSEDTSSGDAHMIAFNFVPQQLRMPVHMPLLTSVLRGLSGGKARTSLVTDTNPLDENQSADAVSGFIAVILFLVLLVSSALMLYMLSALLVLNRSWGVVYDLESGVVIVGARVQVYNEQGTLVDEVLSNNKGRYTFKVTPGKYHVRGIYNAYQQFMVQNTEGVYDGGLVEVGHSGKTRVNVPMRPVVALTSTP